MAEHNGRSLAGVIAELKEELKAFVQTRVSLATSEMRDKVAALKTNLLALIVGAVFLVTAWLLLNLAFVGVIFVAFVGSAYAWAIAFAIVGGAYAIMGGIGLLFAYRALSDTGIMPHRTIKVLEADREWLNQEARSGI